MSKIFEITFQLVYFQSVGRKMLDGSQVLRFWRLMPKGEKILSPKQKDRTKISKIFKINFQLVYFQLVSIFQIDMCK
jgi:hypothetical protein